MSEMGRGSDDEFCSLHPVEGHFYVSHSVDAPPLKWIEICSFCDHISNKGLREQLPPPKKTFVVEAEILRSEELRVDRLGPDQDDVNLTVPALDEIRPSRSLDES